MAIPLYLAKRDSGEPVTFAEIERCLLVIDEKDFQDTQQRRQLLLTTANMASANLRQTHSISSNSSPSSRSSVTSSSKTVHFKNPLTTHTFKAAPKSSSTNTTPRLSPLNLPSTKHSRRNNNNNNNNTNNNNKLTSIVHGCAARVIDTTFNCYNSFSNKLYLQNLHCHRDDIYFDTQRQMV